MRRNIIVFLFCYFFSFVGWTDLIRPSFYEKTALPTLTGRVVDQANILDVETENKISAILERLEPNQVVVATVSTLNGKEIEEYAVQLARFWALGEKQKDNGLLFLIAPNERQTRLEVGYGLEGIITDVWAHQVIEKEVLPYFRKNDYRNGILNGVNAIVTALSSQISFGESFSSFDQKESMPLGIAFFLCVFACFFITFLYVAIKEIFFGKRTPVRDNQKGGSSFKIGYHFPKRTGRSVFKGKGGRFGGGGSSGRW